MNPAALLQVLVSVLLGICFATSAKVVLIGNNITRSFHDVPASFATSIKNSGECGVLYLAQPLDACSDLTNKVEKVKNCGSSFALVIRGGCDFDEKVRRVQKAGFKAAIVYDNLEVGTLIPMDGNAAGIKIHAVFISKGTSRALVQLLVRDFTRVWTGSPTTLQTRSMEVQPLLTHAINTEADYLRRMLFCGKFKPTA